MIVTIQTIDAVVISGLFLLATRVGSVTSSTVEAYRTSSITGVSFVTERIAVIALH